MFKQGDPQMTHLQGCVNEMKRAETIDAIRHCYNALKTARLNGKIRLGLTAEVGDLIRFSTDKNGALDLRKLYKGEDVDLNTVLKSWEGVCKGTIIGYPVEDK